MANRISLASLLGISLVLAALVGSPAPAEAQFGKRLKDRLQQNAEDKAVNKAVDEQNKAIDQATTGGGADSTAAAPAAAAPTPATPASDTAGAAPSASLPR